jgi:hypothetical protein
MQHTITYNDLFSIELDIAKMKSTSPGLSILLNSSINRFYQRSAMHSKVLHSRMDDIKKKYIQHDEEKFLTVGEGESLKHLYKEEVMQKNGELLTDEAVQAAYLAEANDFLTKHIVIDL